MHAPFVFYDPTGRRRRVLGGLGAVAALGAAVVTTLFVMSLLAIPALPGIPGLTESLRPSLHALVKRRHRLDRMLLHRSRLRLWERIGHGAVAPGSAAPDRSAPVVAGFYAIWQPNGLASLQANAGRMTHLMPEWLHVDSVGTGLDTHDWDPVVTPSNLEVARVARAHRLQVQPVLNNAHAGAFDPERAHRLLASPVAQRALAGATRDWLLRNGFQGLNLDLENLRPEDYARLPGFVALLAGELHAKGLALSVDLEPANPRIPLGRIAREADLAILMAYGEHWVGGDPGPIASLGWFDGVMERARREIPADRLVMGIGNYAYDWTEGVRPAKALSYQTALLLARQFRPDSAGAQVVDFDADALNPTFDYADEQGQAHQVWMLDASTAYDQWRLATRRPVRGSALWVLGSEDPGIWSFLSRGTRPSAVSPAGLRSVRFPYEVEFEGEGEILAVKSTPQAGAREVSVDPQTGLVTDEEYRGFPSSFVIQRSGFHPGWVALTFDDGPDDEFTGEVLDELREMRVPATFFVVGSKAEEHPELIRRMWSEGHEIGNHSFYHPNMGEVSDERARLEVNSTQRALESIIGRSTLLFRPPYNADAEPHTSDEVGPVVTAARMGYVTVGELLDPQDWALYRRTPEGGEVRRDGRDLAETILRQVHSVRGNVVLLHTAGGDRSATVAALPLVVPKLREEGYRFVTVSQLLGVPRGAVMPVADPHDRVLLGFDRVTFGTVFTAENVLGAAFLLAIFLGIGRGVAMTGLAVAARTRRRGSFDPEYRPTVSVLIAAYNEEPVIARTLRSVLASDYPVDEVWVVDDGSRDGTADRVRAVIRDDPRVRLIRQPNRGKAAALNRALREASGEVVVCFDADTQVAPDAVGLLVRHFADGAVGAVAGNVKVGNRDNVLTRWQAIEYVTSQNLDRLAYALLNGVTVVPGAIGAWRRSALQQLGGYGSDTLAEDMDLTFRLRRAGWRIGSENAALAFTEAPDTLRGLFRQRFRWAHGTLQCLWKHRGALCDHGWYGWLVLPSLWIFQVILPILAPLVDLQLLYVLGSFLVDWLSRGVMTQDWQPLAQSAHALATTGFFYALFFAVELLLAGVAFAFDRERARLLWWLFWQRFVYRQLMYAVLWKSVAKALHGARLGWSKLERKGTVQLPEAA